MKLQSQLNIAFTTLLVIILFITGYTLYSLFFDILIENEEHKLQEKGELLIQFITDQTEQKDRNAVMQFLEKQNLQLFLYDRKNRHVVYSSLSPELTYGFIRQNDLSKDDQGPLIYNNQKFVTSRILFYPESKYELILLTPFQQLEVLQKQFIDRLIFILVIGGLVAIALSYFLTNKLVTPLSRLKKQLKKIEKRQFEKIKPIQATGEIKEVSNRVSEMAQELKLYIDSQQLFFQNASHELKTPLMTIQGYTEGIRDGIFSKEVEKKAQEVTVQEVKRLKQIINEMTTLAKLDSNVDIYNMESISLKKIISQVYDRLLILIDDKKINLIDHLKTSPTIYVDKEKMLQAMLNILSNATRYAKSNVTIRLEEEKDDVYIFISDDGKGIKKELQPNIFHRFVKGKDGDTGLGLAIAYTIVEKMSGNLSLVSSDETGTTFCIQLPIQSNNK